MSVVMASFTTCTTSAAPCCQPDGSVEIVCFCDRERTGVSSWQPSLRAASGWCPRCSGWRSCELRFRSFVMLFCLQMYKS